MDLDEDAALFRKTVGDITPLADRNLASLPQKSPAARVRSPAPACALSDTLSDGIPGASPEQYLKNGVSRMALKKLKRSKSQASLDLHGYTSDEARRLLQEFLSEAALREMRFVLVIHGKGANSPNNESVLRELTRNWLTQHPLVLAFCPAPAPMGGTGAVLVQLKTMAIS